MRLTALAQFAL